VSNAFDSVVPAIPSTEYPERWVKVQNLMAELSSDFLVAYADDRHYIWTPARACF